MMGLLKQNKVTLILKMKRKGTFYLPVVIYSMGFVSGFYSFMHPFKTQSITSRLFNGNILSFSEILGNNLYVIACELLGGMILLPTVNSLFFSGFALGLMLKNLLLAKVEFKESLLLILPHGILEIPAIIIAGAAGFKIPYEIVRYLAGRKEQILTKEDIKEYLTLALISIVLIAIAAWIEANVTLRIAKAMLNESA